MNKPHVVLCDDDALLLSSLRRGLKDKFNVSTSPNGQKAIAAARENPPDAMVVDLLMPDMDGLEVVRQIRAFHPNIVAIVFSGSFETEAIREQVDAGHVFRYLRKPTSVSSLVEAITEGLATRQEAPPAPPPKPVDEAMQRVRASRATTIASLAQNIGHELNNAITPLIILLPELRHLVETQQPLEEIDLALLESLSSAVRSQAEALQALSVVDHRPEYQDFGELVGEALRLLRVSGKTKHCNVTWVPPEEPLMLDHADEAWQIVMSLLNNAAEAVRPTRGDIEVTLEATDTTAILTINDDGPGVSEAVCAQLFQPWFTTHDDGVHAGLGLHVAQSLAESRGGQIEVHSSDRGFTAVITLPIAAIGRATNSLAA